MKNSYIFSLRHKLFHSNYELLYKIPILFSYIYFPSLPNANGRFLGTLKTILTSFEIYYCKEKDRHFVIILVNPDLINEISVYNEFKENLRNRDRFIKLYLESIVKVRTVIFAVSINDKTIVEKKVSRHE